MSTLTAQQVTKAIQGDWQDAEEHVLKYTAERRPYKGETRIEEFDGEYDSEFWYELESSNWLKIDGLGTLEFQQGYSGGEGGGSDVYSVFKIGDQYFKKTGYYASHYGTDWDGDIYEVTPEEKTITVYKQI